MVNAVQGGTAMAASGKKAADAARDRTSGRDGTSAKDGARARDGTRAKAERMPRKLYETALYRLQAELVKRPQWVGPEAGRLVVTSGGRDAGGKGSTINRVAQYLNPRIAQIVALPAPTEREKTEWYFQRYIEHLPAGGQIVLFD